MKNLLKNLLVPMLANQHITSIVHNLFDCGIPIFMLHRIAEHKHSPDENGMNADHLRQCLEYLKENNYTFISLEQLVLAVNENKSLPSKSVCFTMDDGYIDQAQIAAPIFLEYDCPITFFVITGMLGQTVWPWDAKISWIIGSSKKSSIEDSDIVKQLNINKNEVNNKREFRRAIQNAIKILDAEEIPDIVQRLAHAAGVTVPTVPPANFQPMSWDIARELENLGIRFAPHSVSHNILSRLSQKSMEQEVEQSWKLISNELNNPLKVFCYPNGRQIDFGQREITALQKAGYLGAVSTTPDFVMNDKKSRENVFSLPRLSLPDNMIDFIQYCSWMEGVRSARYKLKN